MHKKSSLLIVLVILVSLKSPASAQKDNSSKYIQIAMEAAEWIASTAIETPAGLHWPPDPEKPDSAATDLYYGSAGIILFLLELHQATGNDAYLQQATAGADYLTTHLPSILESSHAGLYTGVAGITFALMETGRLTELSRFSTAAERCLSHIAESAIKAENGVKWNEKPDIISGSAGIGLLLLRAARLLPRSNLVELASLAGNKLLATAVQTKDKKLRWPTATESGAYSPNFSQGTAGIAYFLASLFDETNNIAYLQAAVLGGRHLQSLAGAEKGKGLIFHHRPGGEALFYLSWCHGPAGTARLFYLLHRMTAEDSWMGSVHRGAMGIVKSGIPENRTDGFWNNVGACCGSAGVIDLLLHLHRLTKMPAYISLCRRLADDIIARAVDGNPGKKWRHAEYRDQPQMIVAQTGYMQGAAGVAMALLRLDNALHGRKNRIQFPDSPY